MITRRIHIYWLVCCVALLAACNSAKYEWSQANSINTVAAYQAFLSKYPNDMHAADAKSHLAQLQDEQAWSTAKVASSLQGYQQYLTDQPNGAHAQVARAEIERERAAAWHTAQTNDTVKAMQKFLQAYPSGPEADRARDELKVLAAGYYRAELGIAHSKKTAERERDTLAKRFGKSFSKMVVLEPDANSRDYGSHRHQ